ncbi:MAG: response regulator transcription factor [Lachnospiraceae bacterium]|nr:response regulator transcription factor [Lachnospiraceae bacterium]
MRIAVCEDEEIFRKQIVKEIEEYYHSLDVVVDSFSSGEELVKKYERGKEMGEIPQYDILFLDIEMKRLDGFDTAKAIRSYGGKEILIYLTSHTELAMQGYEVEAFRFLAKPVEQEKLWEALGELKKRLRKGKNIILHTKEEEVCVEVASIIYVESMKNDVFYHILEHRNTNCLKVYKVREKIANVEKELLEEGFFRCHRSYLVQLAAVESYNNLELTLSGNVQVPISRGRQEAFREALMYWITKK